MKKWLIGLVALAVLGAAGYKVGMNYASEKMIEEVADQVLANGEMNQLLGDPEIRKAIEEQAGADVLDGLKGNWETPAAAPDSASASKPAKAESGQPQQADTPSQGADGKARMSFESKEEAMQFILTKFTLSELKDLASKASGGLSGEEKAEIKNALQERLTDEEYEALKVIGLIEISKRSKQ